MRNLSPVTLLNSTHWIVGSGDVYIGEHLDDLDDPSRLYRSHTFMNCTDVCPKGQNSVKANAEIKKTMVNRHV